LQHYLSDMAGQFDDDFLAQLIELVGFRPYLVSPAVPEYVQNEITVSQRHDKFIAF